MKIKTTQAALNAALSKLNGVSPVKAGNPVLTYAKVFALPDGKGVGILCTDLEIAVRVTLQCEVEVAEGEKGRVLVPCRLLAGIVSSATSGEVTIEATDRELGGKVKVTTATGAFSLATLPVADYPTVEREVGEVKVSIPCEDLRAMLTQTRHAAAKPNEGRATLQTTLVELGSEGVVCVATNGKCLAKCEIGGIAKPEGTDKTELLLPLRAVAELLCLAQGDGDAELFIPPSGKYAAFGFKGALMKTRLRDEKYPNWRGVMPKEDGKTVVVNAISLVNAVKRVSVFSSVIDDKYVLCEMEGGVDGGVMTVSSPKNEVGEAKEKVRTEKYTGEPFTVAFDKTLLSESLSAANAEKVTIHYFGDGKPLAITDEKRYYGIVMPVRVA